MLKVLVLFNTHQQRPQTAHARPLRITTELSLYGHLSLARREIAGRITRIALAKIARNFRSANKTPHAIQGDPTPR